MDFLRALRGPAFANFAVKGFCSLWNALDENQKPFHREERKESAAKDAKGTKLGE